MRRYIFYIAVALLGFCIGSFLVFQFYFKIKTNNVTKAELNLNYIDWVNKTINQIESENKGYNELLNAKDGDIITVQGYFDEKFLCLDVTDSQPDVCTTVLIGSSDEDKSLLIRLPVCSEGDKSNCIVWKPENLCSDGENCSNTIRIYDDNSKPTDFVEAIQLEGERRSYYHKSIKIKATGEISIVEGKYYMKNPVEKIEFINLE